MSETIGERIYRLRTEKGLSQEELAEACNCSYVAISRYENGVRKPQIGIASRIAEYFGVSVDYLLGKAEPKKDTSSSTLPLDEARLLDDYHQLTEEGKARALEYMAFLLQNFSQDSKKTHA